jgi:hypothetical protein
LCHLPVCEVKRRKEEEKNYSTNQDQS